MSGKDSRGTAVPVPHLAESLVAATVGKWLKQPGDYVVQYEVLCELITEKVVVEMPSPIEGTLTEFVVAEGETAQVGDPICYIREQGDAEAAITAPPSDSAAGHGVSGGGIPSSAAEAAAPVAAQGGEHSARFSPAVLKLAAERGIQLADVPGTGLGGRITRKDVLAYAERGPASRPVAPAQAAVQPSAPAHASYAAPSAPPAPAESEYRSPMMPQQAPAGPVRSTGLHLTSNPPTPFSEADRVESRGEYFIDVTPVRDTIASRMRQSATEIPHAWTIVEVDVTNLVQLRTKLKDEFMRKEGINLTYLAFVLKAVVGAIKDYPILNSVWAVDKIIVKRDINISLAVGTEDSVITPVIKKADQKNIAGLAREVDELTRKARSGKLSLNDLQGGTFTLNNTGSFGSLLSYPIINYPQAAILTFESIVKKPVVINDMIAVRSMVNLCLSLDHRILDGVICGRFLQRVKENLESYGPDTQLY
ncbi:dihydrolipoamide acetyltransferase family protein [Gorillibacterium timonense]|uniref:dihydrolipoamide acetyltransferase family protein n=1 Tax=Gorillibacterium timonense TaxID=1689269 RepID=UPI00071DB19D|nr:dihydrolipoamide acetyltransferase family protein [Gorillibacterium timonense]